MGNKYTHNWLGGIGSMKIEGEKVGLGRKPLSIGNINES
jgi:hypothetical protein